MTDRNDVLKPSARRQPDRGKPVPSEFSVLADFFLVSNPEPRLAYHVGKPVLFL